MSRRFLHFSVTASDSCKARSYRVASSLVWDKSQYWKCLNSTDLPVFGSFPLPWRESPILRSFRSVSAQTAVDCLPLTRESSLLTAKSSQTNYYQSELNRDARRLSNSPGFAIIHTIRVCCQSSKFMHILAISLFYRRPLLEERRCFL